MTYILTIAQEGGISKAAAKLFITQSALDQQLLKLEKELGTQLFYRSRTSFALTAAGKVYVDYAKQMVALKDEAYRIIHDLADRQRGTLSLAFAPERGMEMFMAVYPLFYQSYPKINVIPREISVRRQLEMLQNDELDLGFISMKGLDVPGLTSTTLLEEEFVLITPRDHPLAALAAPPGEPLTVLEPERLRELTIGVSAAYGCTAEVEFHPGVPATVNSPAMTALARKAALALVDEAHVVSPAPDMGSEDFAVFGQDVPAFFYWLGSGFPGQCNPCWHNEHFRTDDDALPLAAALLAQSALVGLE